MGSLNDAVRAATIFTVGGFMAAVTTFVAVYEILILWNGLTGPRTSWDLVVTMPLAGLLFAFYGCGFVVAYLSVALGWAGVVAAVSVWRFGRMPAVCLAGLVLTCPATVFAQASALGIWFDPGAETEADALTATSVLVRFSPLLAPALVGAWLVVRSRQGRAAIA